MLDAYYRVLNSVLVLVCLGGATYLLLQAHVLGVIGAVRGGARRGRFVIAGLPATGKTRVWYALTHTDGPPPATIPSFACEQAPYVLDPGAQVKELFANIRVVDTPGDFYRNPLVSLAEHLGHPDTVGVIFCVDSSSMSSLKDAAAYLFELLTMPTWREKALMVCVFNPPDAKPKHLNVVRDDLEREIERLLRSARNSLSDAVIPVAYATSAIGKVLDYCGRRRVLAALARRRNRVNLNIQHGSKFFRFQNLRASLFDIQYADNLPRLRGFIQRVHLMKRK